MRDHRLRPGDLTLIAVKDGERNTRIERSAVDAAGVRIIALHRDILLTIRFGQQILTVGRRHPLRRRLEVRPLLERLQLEILEVALHLMVFKFSRDIVVRRHGFITQLLPKIGKPLNFGKFCLRHIILELEKLEFDLQFVIFADRSFLVAQIVEVNRLLIAFQIFLGQFQRRLGELHVDEQGGDLEGQGALVVRHQGSVVCAVWSLAA